MLTEHLKSELEARSRRNQNYSLRSFARSLKIDSSTLSAILRGKRPLSPKTAKRILDELELDPETKSKYLGASFGIDHQRGGERKFTQLDNEALEVICGWEHYAILSVLELSHFPGTVTAAAKRLNISTGVVIPALHRMERLGLVERRGHQWASLGKQLTTTQGIQNAALRKANREYIEKALYSLYQHATSERDISGITMAISNKKLPQAFEMIRDFRRKLCSFLEDGVKDEVYRLNVQLFPLKK